jgi:hypothetical protein
MLSPMRRATKIIILLGVAGLALTGCGGSSPVKGKASAADTPVSPSIAAAASPAPIPSSPALSAGASSPSAPSSAPSLPDLKLSDQTASGDDSPDFESVEVNGTAHPDSLILADCDTDSVEVSYPVPEGYQSIQASAAVPDDAATDYRGTVEIFVDGKRALVAAPSLGKPVALSVAVGGATTLTVRSYTTSCQNGSPDGVVLTTPLFSSARGNTSLPKSAAVLTYPTEQLDTVADQCDSFNNHDGTGVVEVNGTVELHSLWAGADDSADSDTCYFEYNLSRSYTGLLANFGVSDDSASGFTCRLTITVDGRTLYTNRTGAGHLTPLSLKLNNGLRLHVQFDHFTAAGSCVLGDFRLTK